MQSYVKLAFVLRLGLAYKSRSESESSCRSPPLSSFLVPRYPQVATNMVKFTFAAASLIVASLSAAVSALPATFALYNITSFQTNYALLSDGSETVGSDVSTVQASKGTPGTTV